MPKSSNFLQTPVLPMLIDKRSTSISVFFSREMKCDHDLDTVAITKADRFAPHHNLRGKVCIEQFYCAYLKTNSS
jgi:hypothetical protein